MSELRVLLVDDEEELVSALVERLGYRGIEAKYALNGPDALQLLQDETFDVVVLDFKLPGMSGVEVHHTIKQKYPNLPVVLITGHGAPADHDEEEPGEPYDFLEKPVGLAVLLDKIKEVTEKK